MKTMDKLVSDLSNSLKKEISYEEDFVNQIPIERYRLFIDGNASNVFITPYHLVVNDSKEYDELIEMVKFQLEDVKNA